MEVDSVMIHSEGSVIGVRTWRNSSSLFDVWGFSNVFEGSIGESKTAFENGDGKDEVRAY